MSVVDINDTLSDADVIFITGEIFSKWDYQQRVEAQLDVIANERLTDAEHEVWMDYWEQIRNDRGCSKFCVSVIG